MVRSINSSAAAGSRGPGGAWHGPDEMDLRECTSHSIGARERPKSGHFLASCESYETRVCVGNLACYFFFFFFQVQRPLLIQRRPPGPHHLRAVCCPDVNFFAWRLAADAGTCSLVGRNTSLPACADGTVAVAAALAARAAVTRRARRDNLVWVILVSPV